MPKVTTEEQISLPHQIILEVQSPDTKITQSPLINSDNNITSNIASMAAATPSRTSTHCNFNKHFVDPKCSASESDDVFHLKKYLHMVFVAIIIIVLFSTLAYHKLKKLEFWSIHLWKWELMLLIPVCVHPITRCIVSLVTFLIRRHYPLHVKGLYIVYTLKKTIHNRISFALVPLSWILIVHDQIENSWAHRISIALSVAPIIWLFKSLVAEVIASKFHVDLFDTNRMAKENIFLNGILQALSKVCKEPMAVEEHRQQREELILKSRFEKSAFRRLRARARPKAYFKMLMKYMISPLKWICNLKGEFEMEVLGIMNEKETHNFAKRIFENVAGGKECIGKEDLHRYLSQEAVCTLLPLFKEHHQDESISKTEFQDWVVQEMMALTCAMQGTKKIVQGLHTLAFRVIAAIIVIISFIKMGATANTTAVATVSSSLIFQNACKTMVDCFIFVIMMHPFDIGDLCLIDGIQKIVQEMSILTSVFLGVDDKAKSQCPNADLLTKTITNYNRSPNQMGETIEFFVEVTTSGDTIDRLGEFIQAYLKKKPEYWHPEHMLLVKEIENNTRMMMTMNLQVTHTINFQNFPEKRRRSSELYLALKEILDTLKIKYHIS